MQEGQLHGTVRKGSKGMRAELNLKKGWLAERRVFQADRVAHAEEGTEKRLIWLVEEARVHEAEGKRMEDDNQRNSETQAGVGVSTP